MPSSSASAPYMSRSQTSPVRSHKIKNSSHPSIASHHKPLLHCAFSQENNGLTVAALFDDEYRRLRSILQSSHRIPSVHWPQLAEAPSPCQCRAEGGNRKDPRVDGEVPDRRRVPERKCDEWDGVKSGASARAETKKRTLQGER